MKITVTNMIADAKGMSINVGDGNSGVAGVVEAAATGGTVIIARRAL